MNDIGRKIIKFLFQLVPVLMYLFNTAGIMCLFVFVPCALSCNRTSIRISGRRGTMNPETQIVYCDKHCHLTELFAKDYSLQLVFTQNIILYWEEDYIHSQQPPQASWSSTVAAVKQTYIVGLIVDWAFS